ncbi:hypothetical protein DPMN_142502 [Dreissena polymorpha]|uniref:Uncharacterized protein n=1 Tax=Dreissena polymorpha TaxID=45954 RepID=A0A9D4JJ82_DREPO|nr:hypothetical protein DPMN_142502 [Dreissena polymorpha]
MQRQQHYGPPTGCTAEEGYDETHFYVDVQYPANIRRFYINGSNFASSSNHQ